MRGVTRPGVLDGHFTGLMKSAQGDNVGFEATTTINRTDDGVAWNRAREGGGAMLGDNVDVEIAIGERDLRWDVVVHHPRTTVTPH